MDLQKLITLSILGIVAAIAIPNIIQNYQKRLTITKLKKAYAVLENALALAFGEHSIGTAAEYFPLKSVAIAKTP